MARQLVTFTDQVNEIDVNGFRVMTDKEVETLEELAASITWGFKYRISDMELGFTSGDDFLSRLDYREVSNEEYKVLKKIFGDDFGTFIGIEYLESLVEDEETTLDDEDDFYTDEEKDYDDDY